ncbi:DNAse I-like superfamily protein, partial [Prunus dulcis]
STAKGVRRHGVGPNRSCNEKSYGQKSLSGITVNISKLHLYKPRLCAKRTTDFQKVLALPPSSNGHGTGGVGTTIEFPTFSNRPQPWGRPELAGKSCFPTEVRPKLPKLPARNSPSFLHQIDRKCIGSTTGPLLTSTLQSQVKFWDWSKYRGDSAEFSAEVEEKFEKNLRQKG